MMLGSDLLHKLYENCQHDEEKLSDFIESLMNDSIVEDGTLANSMTQINQIWPLRERLAEALLKDGYSYKYDISLPHQDFYNCVEVMRKRMGDSVLRCIGYGHIGDGNLHLNFTSKVFDEKVLNKIEPYLYEWTSKRKGSISAEHGLGFKKRNFIHYSKSQSAIETMQQIKNLLDPKGILNPYKVLPDQ